MIIMSDHCMLLPAVYELLTLNNMLLLQNETPPPPVKVGKSYRQKQRMKNNVLFFIIGAEGDQAIQQWILPRLSCAGNLQNVDLVFPNILKYDGFFCLVFFWWGVFCCCFGLSVCS